MTTANLTTESAPIPDDEISLIDLLIVLVKNKALIIKTTAIFGVAAVTYALLATPIFEAETTILPPQQQSGASAMLASLGGLGALAGGAGGIKNPNDIYIGMMGSRAVQEPLVKQFDLKKYYASETLSGALKTLEARTAITSGKDGLISIKVNDKDPKRAADLANAYVVELRSLSGHLAVGEAAQRRQLFEIQLAKVKKNLADAEVALKKEQEKTGFFTLEASGKATMEALVALRAQMAARQVQLSSMSTVVTEDNPEYKRVKAEIAGLQAQLFVINKGSTDEDVLVSKAKVPEAGLEFIRKLRDVKYQEMLFELMAKQLEMARLDEAKEGANIQVLDAATPPENKLKPKRGLIVLLGLFAGGFFGILLAFIREALQKASQNAENAVRMNELKQYWKGQK
ncbi:GumC family protein [Deefgea rivuli]|uniref:GumC family protein n=1 Tax=Deefgea rivuli TaxID=400948 RepID=UPI00055B79D5|nr:GNVR domain-containing protein [Deefgea rivuli]